MQLIPNWKQVLFGSWSSRLGALLTLLLALNTILPLFEIVLSPIAFGLVTGLVAAAIPVVRIVQQKALHEERGDAQKATA